MNEIRRNYIFSVACEFLAVILPIVSMPYVSQRIHARGMGIYGYVNAVVSIFLMAGRLGISGYGSREISYRRDFPEETKKLLSELCALQFLTTMAATLFFVICVFFFSSGYRVYYWASIFFLLSSTVDISWYYQGMEKSSILFFWKAVSKLAGLACVFLFVKSETDTVFYIIIQGLTELMSNIVPFLLICRNTPKQRRFLHARHIRPVMVYFVPTLAVSIYHITDIVMLGKMIGDEAMLGCYERSFKIVNILSVLLISVNTALLPRATLLFRHGMEDEIQARMHRFTRYHLMITIPAMAGLIGVAPSLVRCLLGESFSSAVVLLRILAVELPVIGLSNCIDKQFLTPSGKQGLVARVLVVGAVFNVILNWLVIPYWKAVGAASVSVLSEIFVTVLLLVKSGAGGLIRALSRTGRRCLIASGIMTAAIMVPTFFLSNQWALLLIQIMLGVSAYLVALFWMGEETVRFGWRQ